MAEATTATPTAPAPEVPESVDPFDLGDTDIDFNPAEVPAEPAPKKPTPARGPDGKFLPAKPAEPQKPDHPEYLLEHARYFGIPQTETDAMNAAELGRLCVHLLKQQDKLRAESSKERTLETQTVRRPEPTPPPAPEPEETFDLGIDESRYDPDLVAAIKRVGLQSTKRVKELEGELAKERQAQQQRSTKDASDLIDAAFAKLGAKYERFFGKGAAKEMGADQKREYKRRIACLHECGITDIRQVNRSTIVKQLKEAADLLYEVPQATPAEPEPYSEVSETPPANGRISPERWAAATVAKPTQRRGGVEPPSDAKAVRNLEARMRESGVDEPDSEIMEGLL